jgi:NAD(P)-dependent dehydrogenase (short-subunit alcohol dehydrogenase family)
MTLLAPGNFLNQVAVVTGGSSGIGAEVVRLIREGGATVEVADLGAAGHNRVDVTSSAQVEEFSARVRARHGRCDVLVNCAGTIAVGTATECTEADWDRVFAVNVRGTWLMCSHLVPHMAAGSAIVNVASGAGLRAIPHMAAYVSAKHAVVGLTRAMALDHAAEGIRVNCVCPGVVDTPLADRTQEHRPDGPMKAVESFEHYLIKRKATPTEIADSICFLASSGAGFITGATLAVDGGRTMH